MKPPLRVAQIGAAHAHAEGKIETLRKLNQTFEVIGVVEPNADLREGVRASDAYRDLNWFGLGDLFELEDLDAVVVETDIPDLRSTALECVQHGLHVHLDKPGTESFPEFKNLLDEATRRGVIVQMGYMLRYSPAFTFLFDAIQNGWLGKIFEVHGVISKAIDDTFRKELSVYPGGSMFELGCHLIDVLLIVLGEPEAVVPFIRRTRMDKDDLADNMLAVFEYSNATATIRSALVEVEGAERRQFVVCGDQGTVEIRPIEPPSVRLVLLEDHGPYRKGSQMVDLPSMSGRYDDQLLDFAAMVRGEKGNPFQPAHDQGVHKAMIQACGLSLDLHQWHTDKNRDRGNS